MLFLYFPNIVVRLAWIWVELPKWIDWKETPTQKERERVKLKVFSFLRSSPSASTHLNDILPQGVIRTMLLLLIVLSHMARLSLISVFMILLSPCKEQVKETSGKIHKSFLFCEKTSHVPYSSSVSEPDVAVTTML